MTGRCLGCLQELEEGALHKKCYARLFGGKKVRLQLRYLRADVMAEARARAARMSLGGAQPKVGLKINKGELEIVTEGASHLLKPTTERHPYISENEHLCMNIAEHCGLPVPPFCLIPLQNGELAFLIKRFDRDKGLKVHIEDFASVLNLPAASKYAADYFEVGKGIEHHVRDKGLEKLLFLKQLMLSYLIGNNDLHLKNISLIDCEDYYALSPAYDLVCAARYYVQQDLALPLAPDFWGHLDSAGYYTSADFIALGEMLGIDKKPLERAVAALLKKRTEILQLAQASFLPEEEKAAIMEIIKEQFKKFENGSDISPVK